MGFLDLFRPSWKHGDVNVRLRAVRDMEAEDWQRLVEIARNDSDEHVRRVALKKLDDPRRLLELARDLTPAALRVAAEERAHELLMQAALGNGPNAAAEALKLLGAGADLAQVARKAARAEVRRAAVARVIDSRQLGDLVLHADDEEVRNAALAKLDDPDVLVEVAGTSEEKRIALAALAQIEDPAALATIAKNAKNKAVRAAARERLPEEAPVAAPAKTHKPVDKVRKAQQLALCVAAENAAHRDAPVEELAELRRQWSDVVGDEAKPALQQRFAAAFTLHAQRAKAHV
jgi:hypothetical protein